MRCRGKKVWIGYKESFKHGTKLAFSVKPHYSKQRVRLMRKSANVKSITRDPFVCVCVLNVILKEWDVLKHKIVE